MPVFLHPRAPDAAFDPLGKQYPGLRAPTWGCASAQSVLSDGSVTRETQEHAIRLMLSGLFDEVRRALRDRSYDTSTRTSESFWATSAKASIDLAAPADERRFVVCAAAARPPHAHHGARHARSAQEDTLPLLPGAQSSALPC